MATIAGVSNITTRTIAMANAGYGCDHCYYDYDRGCYYDDFTYNDSDYGDYDSMRCYDDDDDGDCEHDDEHSGARYPLRSPMQL